MRKKEKKRLTLLPYSPRGLLPKNKDESIAIQVESMLIEITDDSLVLIINMLN